MRITIQTTSLIPNNCDTLIEIVDRACAENDAARERRSQNFDELLNSNCISLIERPVHLTHSWLTLDVFKSLIPISESPTLDSLDEKDSSDEEDSID